MKNEPLFKVKGERDRFGDYTPHTLSVQTVNFNFNISSFLALFSV